MQVPGTWILCDSARRQENGTAIGKRLAPANGIAKRFAIRWAVSDLAEHRLVHVHRAGPCARGDSMGCGDDPSTWHPVVVHPVVVRHPVVVLRDLAGNTLFSPTRRRRALPAGTAERPASGVDRNRGEDMNVFLASAQVSLDVCGLAEQIARMAPKQGGGSRSKNKRAPRPDVLARAPRPPTGRAGRTVQIMFWNLPGTAPLDAAIRNHASKLPAMAGPCQCRVSMMRTMSASTGARPAIETELQLSSFAEGVLAGWKLVVRSQHQDAHQAVRSAFRSAARVLTSGRISPQRKPVPDTSVQLKPQLESPRHMRPSAWAGERGRTDVGRTRP
jgi:hypothetical protein